MVESVNSSVTLNALSELRGISSTKDSSKETTKNDIINALKQNGMSKSMSVQDIADKYGISLYDAQEIYDELHETDNSTDQSTGYTLDNPLPNGSTVSYHV